MIDTLKTEIQKRLSLTPPLGYVVALNFGDDGILMLDGHKTPTQVLDDAVLDPDTTLTLSTEKMQKILDGDLDPNMAVLLGQLKVSGKMGVALKLASYLEQ